MNNSPRAFTGAIVIALLILFTGCYHVGGDDLAPMSPSMAISKPIKASPEAQAALTRFDMSPAIFVENNGQWDESIRYAFNGKGINVLFTDAGDLPPKSCARYRVSIMGVGPAPFSVPV